MLCCIFTWQVQMESHSRIGVVLPETRVRITDSVLTSVSTTCASVSHHSLLAETARHVSTGAIVEH